MLCFFFWSVPFNFRRRRSTSRRRLFAQTMNDANARVFVKQQQSRSRLAFCVSKISRARGATLTYCFFFSFSLRASVLLVYYYLLLLFSGMMDTVGGVVRSTRPAMGDYRAISRRPDRSAVHGSMAATRRPERGARELDAGRGREVDEGARDAGSEVGGYRERD